ncbi:MAG: hypothetical protein LBU32_04870 [Clostridiales bacterium]|nr:hypothetical protein [Clostridiales bacterium]
MDQCKRSAESRTLQRLSPFERGEVKALSGEGPGAPAIGGGGAAAGRGTERGTARRPDGGSAERLGHFAETGGAAHGKSRRNCRKPLKIAERPDFMAFAGEKPGEGRALDAAAGRAKLEPELSGKPALCAKAPCNCIDPGVMPIKNIDLALKARRKPKSNKARRSGRALGAGVEGRPEAAGAREESGHWEIGSAAGKKSGKPAVPATVERKERSRIAAEPGGRGSGGRAGCRKLRRDGRRRLQKRRRRRRPGVRGAGRRRGARRLFPPSPLQLREGGERAPQRASAPLREKRGKRGRHARAADLQGGGLEQQPSQENSGLQDACGNV